MGRKVAGMVTFVTASNVFCSRLRTRIQSELSTSPNDRKLANCSRQMQRRISLRNEETAIDVASTMTVSMGALSLVPGYASMSSRTSVKDRRLGGSLGTGSQ